MPPVIERSPLVKSTRPIARFSVSPTEPTTSDTLQLFDCSRDPRDVGIAWRAWDFGDGATSVGLAPVHRYTEAGGTDFVQENAQLDYRYFEPEPAGPLDLDPAPVFTRHELEQLEAGRVVRHHNGDRAARHEHLLDPLGERNHGHAQVHERL